VTPTPTPTPTRTTTPTVTPTGTPGALSGTWRYQDRLSVQTQDNVDTTFTMSQSGGSFSGSFVMHYNDGNWKYVLAGTYDKNTGQMQGTDTIYDNDFGTMEVQLSFNGTLTNGDTGWMVTTCTAGHCEIFGYPLLVDLTKL
jgi:hypothetical protein